ncbi:dUTP diphosphatase [Desulfoscipio geothermicus]|uniref:dUTP diphosphatase n=1 Tax=Desulfoscipio geothermicus DSM 3669 TaxID=1121426 RepID=A0A1I6EC36_9FIRM|nr:dUTP diphosphatase [Desulfoscipio geothermicus]SFR15310.1 deoxyuridine 5'-triphosphate nucleotidohydrolase (dut) [Desulfoscipio geothermicus DSM 3669]
MNYRDQINALLDQQDAKGQSKYGHPLEQSTAAITERLYHLAEELVDGLRYTLWVIDKLERRLKMQVQVKLLNPNCRPYRKYIHDAGFDLRANIPAPIKLPPDGRVKIGAGVCMAIPPGYYGDIRGRSSLNVAGILCPGGTVDAGYTGEICVVLVNLSGEPYTVQPYERIAQLTITPIPEVELVEVDELAGSERGNQGFGSTGRV